MKEHSWWVRIICVVAAVAAGLGLIPIGWGVASDIVLSELSKVDTSNGDYEMLLADVVRVVDGDTISVEVYGSGGGKEMLRLIGVDTPETVHPQLPIQFFGPEATQFVKNMCLGSSVKLHLQKDGPSRGKYGRLLVYVELPSGNILNEEIIKEGFGYSYTKYPHEHTARYNSLQLEAKESGRGLWGSVEFSDLPDWLRESNPDVLD
ncbi:thermonuclease family protein [Candidatus Pacearchaeota archaeon]|nr:thermonuclease family protein [Candidatus Pacearchaeota archaeon]